MQHLVLIALAILPGADLSDELSKMRAVGPKGAGAAEAAKAWKTVAAADPGQLPEVFAAFDGASPLARNWLRSAVKALADGAESLPMKELEAFLMDRDKDGEARYLALELITNGDDEKRARLLEGMLDDPGEELRQAAVQLVTDRTAALVAAEKNDEALPLCRKAFEAARDQRQVVKLAAMLDKLGSPVDLADHLGMVKRWKLIGPFDYDPEKADPVYEPEQKLDFGATFAGKGGEKLEWKDHTSDDKLAMIDLNKALAPGTKQVAYAATEFNSDEAREAEIRLGCFTKFQLWLNGEMVLDRADAYTGMRLDHYRTPVKLKKGKNVILMKVYQAEPPPQLPNKLWQFLFRVCTPQGVGLHSKEAE